jgi:RHS repeat-associated protein
VYGYSTSTNTIAQTMTFTITRPDATTVLLTRSTNASSPVNGRLVQTEVKNGAASLAKTVLSYVNDGGGSPQVQSVTSYDDNNAPIKVDFDYDAKANITNKREYGYQVSGAWQVRRRTHTTYTAIAAAVNLPTEVDLYDALDAIIAKATYAYDNYVSMGGMEDYGGASPPGHLSWFGASYTARGNVTGVTQWTDLTAGTTIQHLAKFDIFGSVVKAQVSCCQEKDLTNTDATYWSQPETETSGDPNGVHQTTSTDYDFNTSLPTSATDAGGLITNIGYDAALNPNSVTLPTGASAAAGFDYGNLSSTKTVTYSDTGFDGGGVFGPVTRTLTTTTNYDGWGRVVQTVNPNNAQVNTAYDAMGRLISRTNPFTAGGTPGPATTIQYDLVNKAVITTLPGGNTVRSDYSGSAVTATDQVNRKIKRESDGLGRLIKVTEQDVSTGALTQETSYAYNLLGKLTQVNQGGQYRSYKYDAMGRLLYEKIPEQTPTINDGTGTYWTSAYAYTEFSSVKKKTDARGVETHYAFDALHRATQTWYTGAGGDDTGAVRPALPNPVAATGDRLFGYSSSGALASLNIPNEYTENYSFDAYDRPISVTRWVLGQTYDIRKTYATSYEYNGGGQLSKMIYPSGQQVSVNHDDKGRLLSLTYNPEDTFGYLTGVTYNIEARMTGGALGNGVVQTYGFDANRSQLVSQTATKGATQLINLTYDYQASAGQSGVTSTAGNTHQLISLTGTISGTTESASYTYDLQKRLVTSDQTTNGASAQRQFAYDRWGHRAAVYDGLPGGKNTPALIQTVQLEQSGTAPTNRITNVTNNGTALNYLYDAAGNVTNDGVHSYAYDAANRMVSVDSGSTAQYKYDHQNQRVTKIVGSSWTHYIWEGGKVIGEHDATTAYTTSPPYQEKSARLDYIYARGRMICNRQRTSSTAPWTTRYYLSDVWSTRLVLDDTGNVLGRQAHLPFGEEFVESGTQEKHHFTSYEAESESAIDYAVNRQYSQSVGRFGSADPYQASGYMVDPQSWNRYSYVENDPIHNVDPLGLFRNYPEPGEDPCCSAGDCDIPEPPPSCTTPTFRFDGPLTKGNKLQFPDYVNFTGRLGPSTTQSAWSYLLEITGTVSDSASQWGLVQWVGVRWIRTVQRANGSRYDEEFNKTFTERGDENDFQNSASGRRWFFIDGPGSVRALLGGSKVVSIKEVMNFTTYIQQGSVSCSAKWHIRLVVQDEVVVSFTAGYGHITPDF